MRWDSKRSIAAIAGVAALAVGGGVAYAASHDDRQHERHGAALAGVAERVGVSEAELRAAFEAEALERLDAAVENGRVGEARAASIRARIEDGELPRRRAGLLRTFGHVRADVIDTAAAYLELEPAELLGELRGGATLAEVAGRQGKTAEGLEDTLLDEARDRIHRLVTEGLPAATR
jgi:hypothetical protein